MTHLSPTPILAGEHLFSPALVRENTNPKPTYLTSFLRRLGSQRASTHAPVSRDGRVATAREGPRGRACCTLLSCGEANHKELLPAASFPRSVPPTQPPAHGDNIGQDLLLRTPTAGRILLSLPIPSHHHSHHCCCPAAAAPTTETRRVKYSSVSFSTCSEAFWPTPSTTTPLSNPQHLLLLLFLLLLLLRLLVPLRAPAS